MYSRNYSKNSFIVSLMNSFLYHDHQYDNGMYAWVCVCVCCVCVVYVCLCVWSVYKCMLMDYTNIWKWFCANVEIGKLPASNSVGPSSSLAGKTVSSTIGRWWRWLWWLLVVLVVLLLVLIDRCVFWCLFMSVCFFCIFCHFPFLEYMLM